LYHNSIYKNGSLPIGHIPKAHYFWPKSSNWTHFFPSDLLDAELSINLVFMFRNMRSTQISDLRICDEFNLSAIEGADLLDALGIWHFSLEPPGA
jgi:hypothetical protein